MAEFAVVAASTSASVGTNVSLLLFCATAGTVFVVYGRWQRRSGRSFLVPEGPFRSGDTLCQPPPPRRYLRVVGRLSEIFGWILVTVGVLNGMFALQHVLS